MKVLGRLAIYTLLIVLALLVLLFSLGAVSYVTVLEPSFFKSSLESSGIYEELGAIETELLFVDVDIEDPDVQAVIQELTPYFERALTPAKIKGIADDVIDSIDDWLSGHSSRPTFTIDTADIRTSLNAAIIEYITVRIQNLPPCDPASSLPYDPFVADCRPATEVPDAYYVMWADELTSELPLLDRDQFTSSVVIESPDSAAWTVVPRTYLWGKVSLGLFAGFLVLIGAVAVIVSQHKHRVLYRLGGVAAFVALVLFAGAAVSGLWLAHTGFDSLNAESAMEQGFTDQILLPIMHALSRGVGIWLAIFGAIWTVVAAGLLVAGRMVQRSKPPQPTERTPAPTGP